MPGAGQYTHVLDTAWHCQRVNLTPRSSHSDEGGHYLVPSLVPHWAEESEHVRGQAQSNRLSFVAVKETTFTSKAPMILNDG